MSIDGWLATLCVLLALARALLQAGSLPSANFDTPASTHLSLQSTMASKYFVPTPTTFREGFEKLLDTGLFHEVADHLEAGDVSATGPHLLHRCTLTEKLRMRTILQIIRLASSCRFFQSCISNLYRARVNSYLAKYVEDVP